MRSGRVWAILRREYVQRVRSRWFLFSTLFFPALLVVAMFLPALLVERSVEGMRIGVVDWTGEDLAGPVIRTLAEDSIEVERVPVHEGSSDDEIVGEEPRYRAYLILPVDAMRRGSVDLLEVREVRYSLRVRLRDAVSQAVALRRAEQLGLDGSTAAAMLEGVELERRVAGGGDAGSREAYQVLGFVFAMLLYLMFLVYGQMIARGVVEEKTSDIVEILVSSVRPREMMLGKIVGVGAVGLTQVAIWGLVLAGASLYGLAGAATSLAELGVDFTGFEFPWALALAGLAYFLLGYLLYAAVFAAAGAMVGNEQDIQQVMMPAILPIVVPIILMPAVLEAPDAAWVVTVSLVPLFSPILMPVRTAMGGLAFWENPAAIALLAVTIVGMAWIAGRIYRVGILMKGKRPNLPELLRWVRYG